VALLFLLRRPGPGAVRVGEWEETAAAEGSARAGTRQRGGGGYLPASITERSKHRTGTGLWHPVRTRGGRRASLSAVTTAARNGNSTQRLLLPFPFGNARTHSTPRTRPRAIRGLSSFDRAGFALPQRRPEKTTVSLGDSLGCRPAGWLCRCLCPVARVRRPPGAGTPEAGVSCVCVASCDRVRVRCCPQAPASGM